MKKHPLFLAILLFSCLGAILDLEERGPWLSSAEAQSTAYQASADFSGEQGYRCWYYLDSTGTYMTFDPAKTWWKGAEQYLLLSAVGGHPGNGADAVRRWKAPQGGSVRISGNARDGHSGCGDGVMVSIRKGASILWQQVIEDSNSTGFNFDVTTTVAVGKTLDFVINKRGNNGCDSTIFDPRIVLIPEAPDTTPPTVSITSPTNGATVRGTINVTANASDNVGVARVEFYVDATLKVTNTSSPYSFDLDTIQLSNTSHTIKAKAYDDTGNNTEHQINVIVFNAAGVSLAEQKRSGRVVENDLQQFFPNLQMTATKYLRGTNVSMGTDSVQWLETLGGQAEAGNGTFIDGEGTFRWYNWAPYNRCHWDQFQWQTGFLEYSQTHDCYGGPHTAGLAYNTVFNPPIKYFPRKWVTNTPFSISGQSIQTDYHPDGTRWQEGINNYTSSIVGIGEITPGFYAIHGIVRQSTKLTYGPAAGWTSDYEEHWFFTDQLPVGGSLVKGVKRVVGGNLATFQQRGKWDFDCWWDTWVNLP